MAQEDVAPIRVGLLGAGTVGSQTARLLVEQKDELAARIGRPIELTGVACLDPSETDPFPWIDKSVVTTDTMSVATNADIVVELIGGTGVARKFVLAAIESGASVVTANKALLAKYGPEIYAAAEAKGVDIYFEASVGGAIPFLKPLRESLVGDKVTSMRASPRSPPTILLPQPPKTRSSSCWPWWRMARPVCLPACIRR